MSPLFKSWIFECEQHPLYQATVWPDSGDALTSIFSFLLNQYLSGYLPYQAVLNAHHHFFPETEIQTP